MDIDAGDFALLLALAASIVGGLGILFVQQRWRTHRDAGLLRTAERLGGRVSEAMNLEPRTLRFSIEGRPALIEFLRGEGDLTRVRVLMSRRSPGVFRILHRTFARWSARLHGSRDIQIGDPRFDRDWYIAARPESLAHRIFTEERRQQVIDSVLRISRLPAPTIDITRETLIVRVSGLLQREEDLHDLAQTAIDFVGYVMRLGPEEGIAWVAGADGPGVCPVCAVPMEEAVVHCDKCRTPHHAECWTYVGQCSTYACKGKRWVA